MTLWPAKVSFSRERIQNFTCIDENLNGSSRQLDNPILTSLGHRYSQLGDFETQLLNLLFSDYDFGTNLPHKSAFFGLDF